MLKDLSYGTNFLLGSGEIHFPWGMAVWGEWYLGELTH